MFRAVRQEMRWKISPNVIEGAEMERFLDDLEAISIID